MDIFSLPGFLDIFIGQESPRSGCEKDQQQLDNYYQPCIIAPFLSLQNSGIFCFLARPARKSRRRRSRGTGKPSRPNPVSSLTNPFIYVQFPILVPLASHRDLMIDPQTSQQRRTVHHWKQPQSFGRNLIAEESCGCWLTHSNDTQSTPIII